MPITTIQATAKRHKANMFAGVLVLAAGVVLIIAGAQGDSPAIRPDAKHCGGLRAARAYRGCYRARQVSINGIAAP